LAAAAALAPAGAPSAAAVLRFVIRAAAAHL
jgi:hypothetical protein